MSDRHVIETLLRPAVELYSAAAGLAAGAVCLVAPWSLMLSPSVSYPLAGGFLLFAGIRGRQGLTILRYRRNIRRLPRYVMSSDRVPVSRHLLFIGRGFRWEQKHTQRLHTCRRPEVAKYVHPHWLYQRKNLRCVVSDCPTLSVLRPSAEPGTPAAPGCVDLLLHVQFLWDRCL
ncbi:hypothetical protein [Lonsdalea populi]|uniref:hypothetical protein n=1 Tax=Lonsdalea populi TaxID=1172565 RepID=UPI000A227B4A|nr:hypothetical protein [Lonsdalea populi]OSM94127.1 hypothetical protein AU508_15310 [Lonsdalea populi]RAT66845.1 hypothetical protein AU504_15075 [Lonsdalea populi]RAT72774.1 hypothetical protein AU505_06215 [Lonsdalea populi]RAT75169.1 hypothetical protein AU506_10500 [Lonsdalea populi]RAT77247.1 hypothetical protein AU507_12240 [Lonsdalea populi]